MTDSTPRDPQAGRSPLDEAHLDGFTVEQLSDYLDRGRQPREDAIEASAAAQNALAALSRLRAVAPRLLEAEAAEAPVRAPSWFRAILDQIGVQAHAGRDIPLRHEDPRAHLAISEGAVRALVRTAGDGIEGLLVERSRLKGDVETPGEPVVIVIDVSLYSGTDAPRLIAELRREVERSVGTHTELTLAEVRIRVRDDDKDPEDSP
jgi:uncharacterized alkaline shock family protein YloU